MSDDSHETQGHDHGHGPHHDHDRPDAPLREQSLVRVLGGTAHAVRRHVGKAVMDIPGGLAAWSVLRSLHKTGPISQADLARRIGVAGSTLTRRLDQMEADGLVVRTPDPEDGRRVLVSVAEGASGSRKDARKAAEDQLDQLLDGVAPGDLDAFYRVIEAIRANLRAAGTDPDERSGWRRFGPGGPFGRGGQGEHGPFEGDGPPFGSPFGPGGPFGPRGGRRRKGGPRGRRGFAARTILFEDGL